MPLTSTLKDVTKLASERLPEVLEHFLSLVFNANKPELVQDDRLRLFINSISQILAEQFHEADGNLKSTF